jgi:hypothetical protein
MFTSSIMLKRPRVNEKTQRLLSVTLQRDNIWFQMCWFPLHYRMSSHFIIVLRRWWLVRRMKAFPVHSSLRFWCVIFPFFPRPKKGGQPIFYQSYYNICSINSRRSSAQQLLKENWIYAHFMKQFIRNELNGRGLEKLASPNSLLVQNYFPWEVYNLES